MKFIFGILFLLFIILIIIYFLSKKNNGKKNRNIEINLEKISDYRTVYVNTYGEIKNLGMAYSKYEFSKEEVNKLVDRIKIAQNWKKLPLTNNLKVLLEDYIINSNINAADSSKFQGYINIPEYIQGYYYFKDNNKNKDNVDNTILYRKHLSSELFMLNLDDNELYYIKINL